MKTTCTCAFVQCLHTLDFPGPAYEGLFRLHKGHVVFLSGNIWSRAGLFDAECLPDLLEMAAAYGNIGAGTIAHVQQIGAVKPRQNLFYGIEVYDVLAMYPEKAGGIEQRSKLSEGHGDRKITVKSADEGLLVLGVGEQDILLQKGEQRASLLYADAFGPARSLGCKAPGCVGSRVSGRSRRLSFLQGQQGTGLSQGFGQTGLCNRLCDVADGRCGKGRQCIFLIGCYKNNQRWKPERAHTIREFQTIHAGHMDVEEQEVAGILLKVVQCLLALVEFGRDDEIGMRMQQIFDFVTDRRLVVDDNSSDAHDTGPLSNGIFMVMAVPSCSFELSMNSLRPG